MLDIASGHGKRRHAVIRVATGFAVLWASCYATHAIAADLRCPTVELGAPGEASSKARFRAATKDAPRLFKAVQRDDLRALKRGLAKGDDPNACVVGASLVAHAAVTGDIRLVDALLQAGASLDRPLNMAGETVLLHAVGEGELMLALQLLDHSANIGATMGDGITVLHLAAALPVEPYSVRAREQIDFFRAVLSPGLGTSVQLSDGVTPLMIATQRANALLVKWLLFRGADPNLKDALGSTAIQQAVALGREDIVVALREFALPPIANGQSVVQLIEQGRTAELTQLLSRLSAEGVPPKARQALLVAAILARNLDAIGVLVRWGVDPNAVFDLPDGFDSYAVTPLLFAIGERVDGKIIEQLIKAGADPNRYVPVTKSERPLVYALSAHNFDAASALLRNGADPSLVDPNGGWTPLMELMGVPNEPNPQAWFDFAVSLVKAGANVQANESHGLTALHLAAMGNRKQAIELLLAHGANPNVRDNRNRTALDCARAEKARDAIALLTPITKATR